MSDHQDKYDQKQDLVFDYQIWRDRWSGRASQHSELNKYIFKRLQIILGVLVQEIPPVQLQ